ncbi:MAG: hypothetical protein ACREVR_07925 [Burkholderiales bacterium]
MNEARRWRPVGRQHCSHIDALLPESMNARRPQAVLASIPQLIVGLGLALGTVALPAAAQWKAGPATSQSEIPFSVLQGRWVRPDGGYVITVKGVDAGGKLDAAYANPNPLPFSKAEASRDGKAIKVFLELRAGGYNGSTYALTYDPAKDVLRGVYFQAVAQQKFDVYFARAKP